MLLERISLVNFRQFRDESIEFAQGSDGKNVTIIIGDNGTGKTTFAQAFFWCLYGETEFSDKNMLNRLVANTLQPGAEETVRVQLSFRHGEVAYSLIREQVYKKDYSGRVKPENTRFNIATKDQNGNTTYLKQSLCENEVKSILPKELSRYFFFDGERIEKMSKEITMGKKAQDFAEAVKGLLGLHAMHSAIQHFNPQRSGSVIRVYESSYDSRSNAKISEYSQSIDKCKDSLSGIDARLEELELEIEAARARKELKIGEIKQYADGEKLQQQKEILIKKIDNAKTSKASAMREICRIFNGGLSSFFSISPILHALQMLNETDLSGKDIPFMHAKTIEYLLDQRVCICGTHLDEGSVPCNKVKALIDFLPPQSISTTIGDFKKEAARRADQAGIFDPIREHMAMLSHQDEDLANYTNELHVIDGQLSGDNVREKVRNINAEIQFCDNAIRKSNAERDELLRQRGRIEQDLERFASERKKLTLLDDTNKQIEICMAYAERIFAELLNTYAQSEAEIRERLQRTINDIFKRIYAGGLYLTIDEKYHISVYATDIEGDVETSTAQSISVIFAFITGIIKMARDNRNASDEDAKLLSSDPYPLVMDAPLSAFDKRRIKTVCEALPETAEQVIIFIKDTDGDLAEEYMGARIGSRHAFEKKNEFETILV